MSAPGDNKPYFQAAGFYFEHGQDLQKARKWVDAAIAQNEAYYIIHLKAKILAKLGEKEAAIAAAKRSSELAAKAKDNAYVRLNEQLIASLQ
jgi:predicted RNA polymerase sigma factor